MEKTPIQLKIVLLGDAGVGKSSIVLRYVTDNFKTDADGTVGASYMGKILTINDTMVKLNVWDTAGQERYHSLARMYYKDADAALLVYDITKHDSFDGMLRWHKEVTENSKPNIVIAVAGNKEDLIDYEKVSLEETNNFVKPINAIFKKTSAKSNHGIEELFNEIIYKLHPEVKNKPSNRMTVKLETNEKKSTKKGCC